MTQSTHISRILVTGSGGRLGGLLRMARASNPDLADGFVFQSTKPGADLRWTPEDTDTELPGCATVVALWGQTSGNADTLADNVSLVVLTDRVARACNADRAFHLSSAGIYGPGKTLTETCTPDPGNAYARSKLDMERAVAALDSTGRLRHCCLRLANVVGADSLAPALRGERPLTLDRFASGDGPLRSYIGATDLLGVLKALSGVEPHLLPDVLNIAGPEPVPMEALARAAGRAVHWVDAPDDAVPEVTMDVSRLQALLPNHVFTNGATALIADWQRLETPE